MFVIDTLVVEGAAVRARVKRAHIMKLLRRLRPKHIYSIKHQSCELNLRKVGDRGTNSANDDFHHSLGQIQCVRDGACGGAGGLSRCPRYIHILARCL